jgi:hypothetical protein
MKNLIWVIIIDTVAAIYVYAQIGNFQHGKIDPFQIFWAIVIFVYAVHSTKEYLQNAINKPKQTK